MDVHNTSHIYKLEEIDRCGYSSVIGREGKSILLKGRYHEGSILEWTEYRKWKNGVNSYNLEVNTDGDFQRIFQNKGNGLSFVDNAIYGNENGSHCYRVFARNQIGDTSYSNTTCLFGPPKNYVPNAFTPNGDGLNDVFEPISKFLKSADLSEVSDFSMSIFNRWGEMLYSSNDISASWDGTYRGNACMQGVCMYTIKVAGMDNSLVYESGTITLLR